MSLMLFHRQRPCENTPVDEYLLNILLLFNFLECRMTWCPLNTKNMFQNPRWGCFFIGSSAFPPAAHGRCIWDKGTGICPRNRWEGADSWHFCSHQQVIHCDDPACWLMESVADPFECFIKQISPWLCVFYPLGNALCSWILSIKTTLLLLSCGILLFTCSLVYTS